MVLLHISAIHSITGPLLRPETLVGTFHDSVWQIIYLSFPSNVRVFPSMMTNVNGNKFHKYNCVLISRFSEKWLFDVNNEFTQVLIHKCIIHLLKNSASQVEQISIFQLLVDIFLDGEITISRLTDNRCQSEEDWANICPRVHSKNAWWKLIWLSSLHKKTNLLNYPFCYFVLYLHQSFKKTDDSQSFSLVAGVYLNQFWISLEITILCLNRF